MSSIRWVCLSDTHLGAENSVLSHVPRGDVRVDPREPSPVLEELVRCLRHLVEQVNGDRSRPTLVLNGDALELAVAHGNVAAMAFDQFVELAFAREEPLFDDTILYVPGNHDHHVWEMARESHYAARVEAKAPDEALEAPFHALDCFGGGLGGRPEAELLTNVVRRRAGPKARVEIAYPNLAVASDDVARLVVFHHGHFIEPMYRVMSGLKQVLFPGRPGEPSVDELEADNFAWIDFVWSTFGRSLDVGGDAGLIFLMSQDDDARDLLADRLGNHLGDVWGKGPLQPLARRAGHVVARALGRRLRTMERGNPTAVLGPAARDGLERYLTGPLHRELETAGPPGTNQAATSFVFGHTHKPFEAVAHLPGYARPVAIYNTGGWVVDGSPAGQLHGAAVVLVDDACEVASLRMYDLAPSAAGAPVRVAGALDGGAGSFRDRVEAAIDPSAEPWTGFARRTAAAVERRRRLLPELVRRGVELAGRPPR